MKIYVASSWRNVYQPAVVEELRHDGHMVYDFRNPSHTGPAAELDPPLELKGFQWSEVDPDWQSWNPNEYLKGLDHPKALSGFLADMTALKWSDACVLVLPSGRSAHLEAGWAAGHGKLTLALLPPVMDEPDLMYRMFYHICLDLGELREVLRVANDQFQATATR